MSWAPGPHQLNPALTLNVTVQYTDPIEWQKMAYQSSEAAYVPDGMCEWSWLIGVWGKVAISDCTDKRAKYQHCQLLIL